MPLSKNDFSPTAKKNIEQWLSSSYDDATKEEIKKLLKENPQELENAFFQNLSFGTGGVRAKLGVGTNRLNIYTLKGAIQGFSSYLKKVFPDKKTVLIGYDNRRNSKLFAEEAAKVLAANEISVLLLKSLRPTPLVSFGCRFKQCSAAIMITASHNPPEYNGFKIYWSDGAQVLPPHDEGILEEFLKIQNFSEVKTADLSSPLIQPILEELDQAYLSKLSKISFNPKQNKEKGKNLKIVYTNLHGTGLTLLPKALSQWGFEDLSYVEKQKPFDENFSFAKIPNPEEQKTLKLGIDDLLTQKGDLLLATDPDADRLAIVCNDHQKPVFFSGHQLACLLLESICSQKKLSPRSACIKTIVTTELFKKIATAHHISCFDVLTGFKYIAELIRSWESSHSYEFLFGAEESFGYLPETFARDKDAISTACLLCEMALAAKEQGKTLVNLLEDLYKTYGVHRESSFSLLLPEGQEGLLYSKTLMENFRNHPPKSFANISVSRIEDYQKRKAFSLKENSIKELTLPTSNVLCFWLEDQSKIVIRPSGTEPKIKIYLETCAPVSPDIQENIQRCELRLQALKEDFQNKIEK